MRIQLVAPTQLAETGSGLWSQVHRLQHVPRQGLEHGHRLWGFVCHHTERRCRLVHGNLDVRTADFRRDGYPAFGHFLVPPSVPVPPVGQPWGMRTVCSSTRLFRHSRRFPGTRSWAMDGPTPIQPYRMCLASGRQRHQESGDAAVPTVWQHQQGLSRYYVTSVRSFSFVCRRRLHLARRDGSRLSNVSFRFDPTFRTQGFGLRADDGIQATRLVARSHSFA